MEFKTIRVNNQIGCRSRQSSYGDSTWIAHGYACLKRNVLRLRSVLGPLLFLIYINDLDYGIKNWILKFADDTKLFGKIQGTSDVIKLQDDLDQFASVGRGMANVVQHRKVQGYAYWKMFYSKTVLYGKSTA